MVYPHNDKKKEYLLEQYPFYRTLTPGILNFTKQIFKALFTKTFQAVRRSRNKVSLSLTDSMLSNNVFVRLLFPARNSDDWQLKNSLQKVRDHGHDIAI